MIPEFWKVNLFVQNTKNSNNIVFSRAWNFNNGNRSGPNRTHNLSFFGAICAQHANLKSDSWVASRIIYEFTSEKAKFTMVYYDSPFSLEITVFQGTNEAKPAPLAYTVGSR